MGKPAVPVTALGGAPGTWWTAMVPRSVASEMQWQSTAKCLRCGLHLRTADAAWRTVL